MSNSLRIGVILLAATFPYLNSLSGPFIFDAAALILDDERVRQVDSQHVKQMFAENYWSTRVDSGLYRPISTLSYALNYAIGKEVPFWYHVTNIGLHALAVVLTYYAVGMVAPAVAFWAALVWAVHPVNTEVVASVAGRPDLLATCAVLAGWLIYDRRRRWLLLAIVAAVGIFSKETAGLLLGVVLLHDWRLGRRPWWPGITAIAVPLAGWFAARQALGVHMELPFVDNPEVGMPWLDGRLTAVTVMGRLGALWLCPIRLSADYSYSAVGAIGWQAWVLAAALMMVGAWALWRRAFWVLFVLGCMLPTANLLFHIGSIMAERFLYLPGIGLAVIAVKIVSVVPREISVRIGVAALLALTLRTWDRNEDWNDELRFWRETAAVSSGSFKARSSYALELFERGDKAGAIREAEATLDILKSLPPERDALLPYLEAQQYYTATGDNVKALAVAIRAADILNATGGHPVAGPVHKGEN